MEIMGSNFMPGDPRLIDHIVYELKAQGIFDQFRKECISDVDTKPAYQNLRQRVEGNVTTFLKTQEWSADMNKNQVREMLRKNISESGFLETGVERIVDQVVNPKINTIFLPQVERVVYRFLGIEQPSNKNTNETKTDINKPLKVNITANDLLPNDLEAISPESETTEKRNDQSFDSEKTDENKMEEDESPPFEPLEGNTSQIVHDENSVESHLSGISGLVSHDSNHSRDKFKMDISNQDSQFSKQSSGDGHLSIDCDKMDISEDSSQSRTKSTDANNKTDSNSNTLYFNLGKNEEKLGMNDNEQSTDILKKNNDDVDGRILEKNDEKKKDVKMEKSDDKDRKEHKKLENGKSKTDDKKDRHKSSDKHKSRHSEKDRDRKDKDRKESKDKSSSKDSKDKKSDRDKGKSDRDKSKDDKTKTDKDKSKSDKDKIRDDKDKMKGDKEKSKVDKEKNDKDKIKSDKNKDKTDRDKSKSDKPKSDKDKLKEDKDKSKENKDKSKENKDKVKDKSSSEYKHKSTKRDDSKDKSSSSKHKSNHSSNKENDQKEKEKSSKDSKSKEKIEDSIPKDESKSKLEPKHKSKSDTKIPSDSNKTDNKYKKDEKSSHNDKHKKEKHDKSKKDSKRDSRKTSKDDHYSSKGKKWDRRSTDRDSSDGRSGNQSSQSSFSETPQKQKRVQESSASNSGSGSGDSGNSDEVESSQESEANHGTSQDLPLNEAVDFKENLQVKLIKPKFASNIFEAKRLMKIRKQLHKLERQNQLNFINSNIEQSVNSSTAENRSSEIDLNTTKDSGIDVEEKTLSQYQIYNKRRANVCKKKVNNVANNLKALSDTDLPADDKNESVASNSVTKEVMETDKQENKDDDELISPPLANQVISKESWDALEAKLSQQNLLNIDYSSYTDYSDSDSPVKKEDYEQYSQSFSKALSEYYEPKEQIRNKTDEEQGNSETDKDKERAAESELQILEEQKKECLPESEDKETVQISEENKFENKNIEESENQISKEKNIVSNQNVEPLEESTSQEKSSEREPFEEKISEDNQSTFTRTSEEANKETPGISSEMVDINISSTSKEEITSTSKEGASDETEGDVLYFTSRPESEEDLAILKETIDKLEQEINLITSIISQRRKMAEEQKENAIKRNVLSDSNKVVNSKLAEVTRNNQITTPMGRRGRKRKVNSEECDVHNNNKISNHIVNSDNVQPPQLNHTSSKSNASKVPSPNSKMQAKKSKTEEDRVIATGDDKFSLPLSPSESENSFSSERKESEFPKNPKRKSSTEKLPTKMQRYSSDDLYKPRLNFSSRRRSARTVAND